MGDEYLEIKYILSGVPQCSVLGPLFYDLPVGIKSIIKLFADDVKMIVNPFKGGFNPKKPKPKMGFQTIFGFFGFF